MQLPSASNPATVSRRLQHPGKTASLLLPPERARRSLIGATNTRVGQRRHPAVACLRADFFGAGDIIVNAVARWNGSTWSRLETGAPGRFFQFNVNAFKVFDFGTGLLPAF